MKTLSRIFTTALALGGAMTMTGAANAHDWNGRGNGWGYSQPYGGGWDRAPRERDQINRYLVDTTCSGQRGNTLEHHLRFQVNLGRIDDWTARRIHSAIDRLQYREQHECGEGDFGAVQKIGREYMRISSWIDDAAGQYRGGYGGGY